MNVRQLSIAYIAEQDRVLVRMNTNQARELKCWLTRRLVLDLSLLMQQVATSQAARLGGLSRARLASMDQLGQQAVAEFVKTESLRGADFATPYRAPAASVPVFERPMLVTEAHVTPLDNGQIRLSCSEKLSGNAGTRSFEMALSDQLVHAFMHLLERAVVQSRWRESPAMVPTPGADAAVPGTAQDKPGYLN